MRTRLLLLTAPSPPQEEIPLGIEMHRPLAPHGVLSLCAAARGRGHEVLFHDLFFFPTDVEALLRDFRPDAVGISCTSVSAVELQGLVTTIRRVAGDVKILVGGPLASLDPDRIPDTVDFVVQGEGEKALLDILAGKAVERVSRYPLMTVEELMAMPLFNADDFLKFPYNQDLSIFSMESPVITVNSSRGCPFNCRFCSARLLWERRYRALPAAHVVKELKALRKRLPFNGVYFREDNFAVSRKRVEEFCTLIKRELPGLEWAIETRADHLDRERIQRVAECGCKGVFVGVESFSQRMLDLMNKGVKVEQSIRFLEDCRAAGVRTLGTICYGFTGETEADRIVTDACLERFRPAVLGKTVFVGIPRSDEFLKLKDKGGYYHIDKRGFLYPNGYQRIAERVYGTITKRYIPAEPAVDDCPEGAVSIKLTLRDLAATDALAMLRTVDAFTHRDRFFQVQMIGLDKHAEGVCRDFVNAQGVPAWRHALDADAHPVNPGMELALENCMAGPKWIEDVLVESLRRLAKGTPPEAEALVTMRTLHDNLLSPALAQYFADIESQPLVLPLGERAHHQDGEADESPIDKLEVGLLRAVGYGDRLVADKGWRLLVAGARRGRTFDLSLRNRLERLRLGFEQARLMRERNWLITAVWALDQQERVKKTGRQLRKKLPDSAQVIAFGAGDGLRRLLFSGALADVDDFMIWDDAAQGQFTPGKSIMRLEQIAAALDSERPVALLVTPRDCGVDDVRERLEAAANRTIVAVAAYVA